MTLDAMHWVWNHSQSKGNTRIALLYVADQVRTSACEIRVGQRELMGALNTASKGTAEAAVKKAVELRELEIVEAGTGRRPALYRLPKAVGYAREALSSAPDSGAQDSASAPESGAQRGDQGLRSAPKTGAQENRSAPVFDASAPKTGAPTHTQQTQASQQPGQLIPAWAKPLIDALGLKGMAVSWGRMSDLQWITIQQLMKSHGIPYLVHIASTRWNPRNPIKFGKLLVEIWREYEEPPVGSPWHPDQQSRSTPNSSPEKPPYCGDPDCDEITRMRQHEDDNGLRSLYPCPDCHPKSRKDTAA
ncbi:hypothetical protein ABZX95_17455 [Streptomyces sp. NPDC004232]|uniref:hypothetical protein n=1 Tax=Streptomyces sp. NPDC004232 TaxID=3154454 RepID=UPI0033A918F5